MESKPISLLSWNVHGLKAKLKNEQKKKELLEIIKTYDVVLLQETRIGKKNTEAEEDETDLGILIPHFTSYTMEKLNHKEEKNGKGKSYKKAMYLTYYSSRRRGVAIIINTPHIYLRGNFKDGDYAWVYVEINCQKYTFMSVYYHQNEQDDLMNSMSSLREDPERADVFQKNLIIGGDFNTTLDPDLDAVKINHRHDAQRRRLEKFLEIKPQMVDVWRKKNPREKEYTYTIQEEKSRLDYIFMLEKEIDMLVKSCKIEKDIKLSDHFPVSLNADTSEMEEMTRKFANI